VNGTRASARGPHLAAWRRAAQAAVALFYLSLPLASLGGPPAVSGTLASLKVGPVDLNEPAASVSAALAARRLPLALLLGALPVLLLAVALGPVFCSWICPWGLVSEGVARLRKPPGFASCFRPRPRPRAAVLAGLLVLSLLLGVPLAALLSPPRLVTALPLESLLFRAWPAVTGLLLLALLGLEIAAPRLLCTNLCPAGTLAALVRSRRGLAVSWDPARCACPRAPHCEAVCPWRLDPRSMDLRDGCTNCLACVDGCPTGALGVGFGAAARGE
jgi:ferredoxin-type protein NapH